MACKRKEKNENTRGSLNIVFFTRIFNILRPLPRQHCAAIGCTKNSQPIIVTVNSDELLSYMQGMDCSELGKNTILLNTLYIKYFISWLLFLNKPFQILDKIMINLQWQNLQC